jgi:O-methyltransferase domain
VGDVLHRASRRAYGNWNSLPAALRTGQPQSGAFGTDGYGALYEEGVALEAFLRAMSGSSLMFSQGLAHSLDWSRYTKILDVGTAEGCVPVRLALAHPHLTGVGFDLPPVEPWFARYVDRHGLSDRVRFCAGDFHRDPLPKADVVIMGRVLHNWEVSVKRLLLGKAYAALPSGGPVVVCETLIDDGRCANADALLASLHMVIETAGGHEATGADYTAWLEAAGFCDARVQDLGCAQSAVIGFKR